mmetsp:Transcript_14419/g.22368  ORF Transcript_14419/g.22368 Transcript_14419/m.22368 type:complete len:245 (+) Transcript_14419:425-1159(+)
MPGSLQSPRASEDVVTLTTKLLEDSVAPMMCVICPCFFPKQDHEIFKACESSNAMETVRTVIRRDPESLHNNRADDNATPLHVATMLQDADLVRLMLSSGADPCALDADGRTPLHVAALSGNVEISSQLLESQGVSRVDLATKKGHTALFLACWRGHLDVAQMLHSKGASELKIDTEGKSMIDRAQAWNQTRVVEWLKQLRDQTLSPPVLNVEGLGSSDDLGSPTDTGAASGQLPIQIVPLDQQ